MKTPSLSLASALACTLNLLAASALAQSRGFYVSADAGAALAEDVDLKQYVTSTPGAKMKLETGGRFSFAGGFNFNDYFGAQIESGFIFNDVKSVSGTGSFDAALGHSPLIVSAVVRYDQPRSPIVVFGGVGAGGDISIISLDWARGPNGVIVDGDSSDAVFAWQAFAGVRYKINDRISLGASYKYYWADSASFDVDYTSGDIKIGETQVHSVLVDFNFKF
jgi:opacity protein-like surface antigen